jgi:HK97 family phage portal protein
MPNLVPVGYSGSFYAGTVIPPLLVNSYSALTIPAFKRAVQFISENLASFGRSVHQNGSPAPSKHPLDKLLSRRPNNYQNAFTFWQTIFGHMAHRGNGYAQIERDGQFRPFALNNLLPEHICSIRYDHNDGRGVQQYYHHIPTGTILPGTDMIHLRFGISYDGMVGIDPICLHETTFQRAMSLDKFQTLYIQKGTVIRGSIEIPHGVSTEQVDEIKYRLRTYFRGADAEEDVLVLSDGAKLNNTTITPEESELSKQESAITKQIAQIMGVPPEFLYEQSEAKYNNNVEQAGQNVVRYTFRPIIEQVESELTLKLFSDVEQETGYSININPNALLRGSTVEQETLINSSVNAGMRTKNEGRSELGLPAVNDPNADKLKTLGDTAAPPSQTEKTNSPAPTPTPPPPAPSTENAAEAKKTVFDALAPVIDSACERVDTKSEKAFADFAKKPDHERTIWTNVFADSQEKYAVATLTPVSESIVALGGPALDMKKIAARYAASIRKRAITGEVITLRSLLSER